MSDYKPNSHKYKTDKKTTQPERKIESVVSGKVKTKKKSEISLKMLSFQKTYPM